MKVTFPHVGTMHIFCKAIAETAGIDYLVPPKTSKRTLTLGVRNCSECICLSFLIPLVLLPRPALQLLVSPVQMPVQSLSIHH